MVNSLLTIVVYHNVQSICRVAVEQGTNDEKANPWYLGLAAWRRLEQLKTDILFRGPGLPGPFRF
jgi:hypothetical protein